MWKGFSVRRLCSIFKPASLRFLHPRHLKCLDRFQPLLWFPLKTSFHKFNQIRIIYFQGVTKWTCVWLLYLSTAVCRQNWLIVIVEEHFSSRCFGYQRSWGYADDLHDWSHLIIFILPSKNGSSYQTFKYDTAKAPHIDSRCVRNTKHNLRCTVKSGLNIGIKSFQFKTTATIINELNLRLVRLHE